MDSNNNDNSDDSNNSDDNIPELETTPQLNNPFTQNVIINDDALTDLFVRMFNNPRFTGRVNYRFPPPVTISRNSEENNDEENNDEENNDEEDEANTSPDEEQMRQQAETFITNLTNLIARPNLNTMRYRNPNLSRRRFEQLLLHSFNQKPKYKKVLSEEGEQQLKKMLYKDSSKTNESCPIYYLDFEDDSEVIELPCKHCFTPAGIEKWLKEEKNECPICRFELKSKEVKEKIYEEDSGEDGDDDGENDENEEAQEGTVNMIPLLSSMRNAYNPSRSRLFQPTTRESVPHSYIDSLLASEEERQMEAAILASIRDLESNENNEENNEEDNNEENNEEDNDEDTDLDNASVD